MNNYVSLERPCTLEVKIMNPDSLQEVELELNLFLNNKHIIKFNWNIKSKLYKYSDIDTSEQIKKLTNFSIDEFNSYGQSISIDLFADKSYTSEIRIPFMLSSVSIALPNIILVTKLTDTNIPQSLTSIEDVEKVLFLLLGYNALGKLKEFEISYLIKILNKL